MKRAAGSAPWTVQGHDWPAIGALPADALATAEAAERLGSGLEIAGVILNTLALYHRARKDFHATEPLQQRAMAIAEKTLGPEHPDLAANLTNLALLYKNTGRFAEAEPLLTHAIAILDKIGGPKHPNLCCRSRQPCSALPGHRPLPPGLPLADRAIAIAEKTFGPDHLSLTTGSTTWPCSTGTPAAGPRPSLYSSVPWPSGRRPSAPSTAPGRGRGDPPATRAGQAPP